MKPGFNASVELFCSGSGVPQCNGKLAVVSGQDVGKIAGTDEESGLNKTLVWTSTPVKECPCADSVVVRKFAASLEDNRKVLEAVGRRDLQVRVREWGLHVDRLMQRAWATGNPDRLLETHDRAARALSLAQDYTDHIDAAEESLEQFNDLVLEEMDAGM